GRLFKDPLQRRLERRGEVEADRPRVVPQVDVDNRIRVVRIEVLDAVARRVAQQPLRLTRRNGEHDGVEVRGVALRQAQGDTARVSGDAAGVGFECHNGGRHMYRIEFL